MSLVDTIELSDGTVREGGVVGTGNGVIMFNTGDDEDCRFSSHRQKRCGAYNSRGDTVHHGAIQTYPFDFGNYNLGSRAGTA